MDKDVSQTFARGLAVLAAFDGQDTELTISELAKKTELNRTIVRRIVITAQRLGYVEATGNVYRLTPKILRLANGFLRGPRVGNAIWPVLLSYSTKLEERISFAMLDGHDAVYVAHSPGDPRMTMHGFTVGSRLPLFATAIGRSLLAFSEPDVRDDALETVAATAFTKHTITVKEEIAGALQVVRDSGFAFVADEFEDGVTGLAVPVTRPDGTLIGALGVAGPNPRYADAGDRREKVDILKECADAISLIY